jgi:general secretion pathway protein F
MIAAGEMSGDLAAILDRIADYAEKTEHVRGRVKAALVYPAVLATVALGVLALLVYVVVPRIAQQFDSFETQLPLPTRIVIGISEFFATYGGFVVVAIVLGVFLLRRYMANPGRRLKLHDSLLALPFIGRFIQTFASARFARTLGTLIDGGSSALDAIRAARETQSNLRLRAHVDTIYDDVFKGRPLGTAFRDAKAFSPLLIYMVGLGEKTGALATLLLRSADYLEQEVDIATQGFLSLLEPLVVIIMGLLVGFIVMAIMLPIMQLNTLILN